MGEPASNERVTVAILGEKLDNVSDKIDDLCQAYQVDSRQMVVNTSRITSLELRQMPCVLHNDVVKKIDDLRLDVARISWQSGVGGGMGAGGLGVVVYVVGKLLKIW
jgi:hypothetical protein